MVNNCNLVKLVCERNGSFWFFTTFHPLPRDAIHAPIGTTNGPGHAGYGVCVTTKADSIGDQLAKRIIAAPQECPDCTGNCLTCRQINTRADLWNIILYMDQGSSILCNITLKQWAIHSGSPMQQSWGLKCWTASSGVRVNYLDSILMCAYKNIYGYTPYKLSLQLMHLLNRKPLLE